ncbi:MAG: hypothetical protein ABEK50_09930 [bacterium]
MLYKTGTMEKINRLKLVHRLTETVYQYLTRQSPRGEYTEYSLGFIVSLERICRRSLRGREDRPMNAERVAETLAFRIFLFLENNRQRATVPADRLPELKQRIQSVIDRERSN